MNIPVTRGGVTRIVSTTDHDLAGECDSGSQDKAPATDQETGGASVQWRDTSFGYIMGSWSPVSLSSFVGPLCAQNPQSSTRFARGWVIGPTSLPAPGAYGYIALPGALEAQPSLATPCPTATHTGFTSWVRDSFSFTFGLTFDALMSEHYSRSNAAGDGPGEAQQVERTYWTEAFGLSRWEKWSRDDWVNPRNHMTAMQQASALYQSGDCKTPYSITARVSPHLAYEPASAPDAFARSVRQPDGSDLWS